MNLRPWSLAILAVATLHLPATASAKSYKVDIEHTTVAFRVRHLFTTVSGRFDRFDGAMELDLAHPENAKISGSVDVASVNTNLEERDKDLRSPRFFDAARFPAITFTSVALVDFVKDPASGQYSGKLQGKLTIHGIERSVVLDVRYLGEGKDPWGNAKAGFSARTRINRKDFGLSWNETLETGGVLVGDEVDIEIDSEATVQP